MRQEDEKCENCKYYHVLKHNFKQYVGFEESHCCTYFRDNLEDNDVDWFIIEVKPDSMCEVFTRKK